MSTQHFVSARVSKCGNPTQNLKRFCVNTTFCVSADFQIWQSDTEPKAILCQHNIWQFILTTMAVLLVLPQPSGSAAPQSCGIFAATRPRWAPKGLTLGACSIFRGSGAAGASAALQLAAASQAAGCSCSAPAQMRRKKRRIRG